MISSFFEIIQRGRARVDFKNAVTSYYDDGLYDYEEKVLRGELSAQSYLESVGTVYRAKASDFGG